MKIGNIKLKGEKNNNLKKSHKVFSITFIILLSFSLFIAIYLTIKPKNSYSISINNVTNTIENNSLTNLESFLSDVNTYIDSLDLEEDYNIFLTKLKIKINELSSKEYDDVVVDAAVSYINNIIPTTSDDINITIDLLKENITSIQNEPTSTLSDYIIYYDENVTISSFTANNEIGNSFDASLNGYIYYSNEESTKWVILLHGFTMNGKQIASSLAQTYLDEGYNVLAPDSRGYGKSTGSTAMGYLESLDLWDWLTYINDSTNPEIGQKAATEIIIHGISLGGATVLQLWTQADMNRDLKSQNVIGIIDDSGYDSMTNALESLMTTKSGELLLKSIFNIATETDLNEITKEELQNTYLNYEHTGINQNDFEYKQNSLSNTRVTSQIPIYIIHGTADTIISYPLITTNIYPYAINKGLLYDFWLMSGQEHASITYNQDKEEYNLNINKYIKYLENNSK